MSTTRLGSVDRICPANRLCCPFAIADLWPGANVGNDMYKIIQSTEIVLGHPPKYLVHQLQAKERMPGAYNWSAIIG